MPQVNTAVFNEETDPKYSKLLIDSIQTFNTYYLKPIYYDSLDAAIGAINDGKALGAIWFSGNFTQALDARLNAPDTLDNQTLANSNVKLFLDTSYYIMGNGFIDSMRETVYSFVKQLNGSNNFLTDAPIEVRETIYGEGSKLSDFLLPGYIISFIYLSQVSLASQLLIQEKKDGIFERSLVAGVGHYLVFFSHFISSCILAAIQIVIMLTVSLFIYNVTNFSSYQLIFILVFGQAVNGIAIGRCNISSLQVYNTFFLYLGRLAHFQFFQRRFCGHFGIDCSHLFTTIFQRSYISNGTSASIAAPLSLLCPDCFALREFTVCDASSLGPHAP